jgi:hypothetical protein
MNDATVTAADFDNQGTSTVTIGTPVETSPGVFTLQITPTSAGTLRLRIPAGSILSDTSANNLVVPVSDDTTITVRTHYENWASTYGLAGNNALPGSNPDGDALNNLQEYAFGTNPTNATTAPVNYAPGGNVISTGLPVPINLAVGGGVDYRAVFGRRKNHQALGLTYTVQFSADLATWVSSTATPAVLTDPNSNEEFEVVGDSYPMFIPVQSGHKKPTFFRVVVSIN